MLLKPRNLALAGVIILGIATLVSYQSTISSHIQGKLTALNAVSAPVACTQTQVKSEVWFNLPTALSSCCIID